MRLNHKKNTLYYEELQKFDLVKLFFCKNIYLQSRGAKVYVFKPDS